MKRTRLFAVMMVTALFAPHCSQKEERPAQDGDQNTLSAADKEILSAEYQALPKVVVVSVPLDENGNEDISRATMVGTVVQSFSDASSVEAAVQSGTALETTDELGASSAPQYYPIQPVAPGTGYPNAGYPSGGYPGYGGGSPAGQVGNNAYNVAIQNSPYANVSIGGQANNSGYGTAYAGPQTSQFYQNNWYPRAYSPYLYGAGYPGMYWGYQTYGRCYYQSVRHVYYTYRLGCFGLVC